MRWFREHVRLVIPLTLILVLIILSGISYAWKGDASPPGRLIHSLGTFVTEPVSKSTSAVSAMLKGIFQFKKVAAENERLRQENADLQAQLTKNQLDQADLDELKRLTKALSFHSANSVYKPVTGEVVAMDSSLWFRIFTINIGSKQGSAENSVVVNADGLVGRVVKAGSNWSKVVSIIDENTEVSFRVYRDPELVGVLKGDGKGRLTGYMLDADAEITKGDLLIASGLELYPRGLPIGKISCVIRDDDALLQKIEVKPAVNFKKLRIIAVLDSADGQDPAVEDSMAGAAEGESP
ncbi:MAG TPA: rod shape-determining protein MreC [Clostridiales bacterium]|nr:rod shape-determining protein MreC [Clostridiales bacterium]